MYSFCHRRKTAKPLIVLLGAIVIFLSLATARAQNVAPQKLAGHIPEAVKRLMPLGRENGSERLNLAIGLPLRNQEELTNLLQELYDPASPNFRHFLTPEEFTERFGPTEEDYQAVIRFAEQNGLIVTTRHPNRLVLDVQGQVSDIERTLHVTMRTYQHPTEARMFHAPDTEPTVDLAVPILHISGLDDYSLPHPKSVVKPLPAQANATPNAGSGSGGTYRGNDFRAAYGVGSLTGAGQTVGLLQFDGYYASDIATYESQAGLPSVPLTNVAIDGGVSKIGSGVTEVSLDIEMVISMAPGVSKIIVYEAPNPSPWVDLLSRMANDNLAQQISCSWGGGGPDPSSEQIFLQMAAQGQSFFNATGDSDAFTGQITFPSDSTNITEVGGTTLTTTGPGGSYVSETVWNWGLQSGKYVGSSGGISTTYALPPWQQGIATSANQGSTTMRNTPDVALTADNVYVVYGNGSSGTVGGTSCAAPLWGGLAALINQQAAMGGHSRVGFLNPALYALAKSSLYASTFHDVTTGNNFTKSSPSKFSATTGYDLCTGWGTPIGTNLINALAPLAPVPVIVAAGSSLTAEGCFPTNGVIDSGETVTVNFGLENVGVANTTNLVVTLLATNGVGLPSGPQGYGVLQTNGTVVSQPFTFTALGSCGGTITATFQLQDGSANLGVVTFVLPIGGLASTFVQNFDGVTAPSLPAGWTTYAGGAQVNWTTSTSSSDSAPNSAFASDAASTGSNVLVSPAITLPGGTVSQLYFRNNYNLEARTYDNTTAYDGGVLEIKIGAGSFTDIQSAGGSFVSGGYNRTVSTLYANPLAGRQCWSGNSAGFITTLVNLPASAAGQSIQLRWICGTDSSQSSAGWYVDSIGISNITCCSGSVADVAIGDSEAPAMAEVSSNVTFTLSVTNLGPDPAGSVVVTDSLPAGLTFTTASVSQGAWSNTGNSFTASLGTLPSQAVATLTLNAIAAAGGQWTNSASVSSSTPDSNAANNTASVVESINSPPTISAITNVITVENVTAGPISFVIGDAQTPASSLVVSATSSDSTLIDPAHIIFGGSGANLDVTLEPLANSFGSCTITISVSDGIATTSTSFTLTVSQVNQSVVLSAIPDFTILEKDTLSFTNKASESGQASPVFSFSLSNAPAGASIDPNSGAFTWTPTEAQGPSTNQITVFVADNGAPPLVSGQAFTVVVLESNEPPVLAPVSDQIVHAGMTVTVTNPATDPDIPTNTLTFSLNSAVAGATIDTNGVFVWTPDSSFANTTNNFTVVVTDYNPWAVNTQHLSASNSFNVVVVPPPTFSADTTTSNGIITFSWSSISGQTYRVQYTTNIGGGEWSDLPPDVTATNSSASATDATTGDTQRFYRVLVLP